MSNELRYYNALKRITKYQTPKQLRKHSQSDWGCEFEEAIEMAYESIQNEARQALHGKRKPLQEKP